MRTLPLFLAACATESPLLSGLGEPVQVLEGTFQQGELPEDPEATTPLVSNAGSIGSVVTQGQGSVHFAGLASPDTYAVAVAFPGLGEGYWTVPVGGPDVTADNQLGFQLTAAFGVETPYGVQQLGFVAIDEAGAPGPRYDSTLCILPENANNSLAACDPSIAPQSRVLTLSWNTDVDLDLRVVTPSGKEVSAKAPTTVPQDGTSPIPSASIQDPTTGRLSRDSNAQCVIDGIRRESLVFPGEPEAGTYRIWVSLASMCGERAVTWRLDLLSREEATGDPPTWQPLTRETLATGQLLPIHADGGATRGTHALDITLP